MTEKLQTTIIPAAPGWYVAMLVEATKPEEDDIFDFQPIIAWGILGDDDVGYVEFGCIPITLAGPQRRLSHHLIKSPDGKFFDEGEGGPVCDDEDDALKMLRRRYD